jgi:hypothetical protein
MTTYNNTYGKYYIPDDCNKDYLNLIMREKYYYPRHLEVLSKSKHQTVLNEPIPIFILDKQDKMVIHKIVGILKISLERYKKVICISLGISANKPILSYHSESHGSLNQHKHYFNEQDKRREFGIEDINRKDYYEEKEIREVLELFLHECNISPHLEEITDLTIEKFRRRAFDDRLFE